MEKMVSDNNIKVNSKFRVSAVVFSALTMLTGLSSQALAADPKCDATTGASHRIMGITTTTTTASVAWREGHTNGERWYCIGIDSATKCAKAQSRADGEKNEVFSGLTPNTKYKYMGYGVWGGKKSFVNGTFTTDGTSCWMIKTAEIKGITTTEGKVPLENVEVKAILKSNNTVAGIDTTDQTGAFSILVKDEANYTFTFAYPPFSPPGSQSNWIQVQTVKTLSNLVFKGAFQIGGTILASNGKDSVAGVTVKVTNKSDGAVAGTITTNAKGHFNIGLKTGEYLVTPSLNGVTVPPIPLSVNKDAEMLPIKLGVTVALQKNKPVKASFNSGLKPVEFRANGTQLKHPSDFKAGTFRKN